MPFGRDPRDLPAMCVRPVEADAVRVGNRGAGRPAPGGGGGLARSAGCCAGELPCLQARTATVTTRGAVLHMWCTTGTPDADDPGRVLFPSVHKTRAIGDRQMTGHTVNDDPASRRPGWLRSRPDAATRGPLLTCRVCHRGVPGRRGRPHHHAANRAQKPGDARALRPGTRPPRRERRHPPRSLRCPQPGIAGRRRCRRRRRRPMRVTGNCSPTGARPRGRGNCPRTRTRRWPSSPTALGPPPGDGGSPPSTTSMPWRVILGRGSTAGRAALGRPIPNDGGAPRMSVE